MALVMVLRAPVARLFGAKVAYALWLLPAARLFMPPLVEEITLPAPVAEPVTSMAPVIVASAHAMEAAGPDWTMIALSLWLGGAVLLFLWRIGAYLQECNEILEVSKPIETIGRIRVVETFDVRGPLAFGMLRKYIAVPPAFFRDFSDRERELALAHEVSHHESGDLFVNFVAFLVLCLHWFNPVAWHAWRAFRFDQEAACDARILAQTEGEDHQIYGRAVAKAASGRPLMFASALDSTNSLKKRLKTMAMNDKTKFRRIAGLTAIGAGLAVALPLTATVSYAVTQEPVIADAEVADTEMDVDRDINATLEFTDDEDNERYVRVIRQDGSNEDSDEDGHRRRVMLRQDILDSIPSEAELRAMIPSEAELRAMVPDINIEEGCDGSGEIVRDLSPDDDSSVHLVICREAVGDVRRAALEGLREARAEIASEEELSGSLRAEILAELDESIAELANESR
jgi:beta-lactamase regulating signal transducer with metallopeptidase domain